MSSGATGLISKIVEQPDETQRQRDKVLSLVAVNLATCLASCTVGRELIIANKTFVGVVRNP